MPLRRILARLFALAALITLLAVPAPARATGVTPNKVLFDATKAQMAGNADWVIDADVRNLTPFGTTPSSGMTTTSSSTADSNPQRYPTPPLLPAALPPLSPLAAVLLAPPGGRIACVCVVGGVLAGGVPGVGV